MKTKKVILVCDNCGGCNIATQITFMIDPNNIPKQLYLDGSETWDDWSWCQDCENECIPVEIEGEIITL